MGLFESADEELGAATERACAMMADDAGIGDGAVVCEVACGVSGSSRHLAHRGARVYASNISPEQVVTAEERNTARGWLSASRLGSPTTMSCLSRRLGRGI